MKKVYKLENLGCANCARKMEDGIRKLDGVTEVNINFLTQKMTLEADEEKLDKILPQAAKICRKIERDCKLVY